MDLIKEGTYQAKCEEIYKENLELKERVKSLEAQNRSLEELLHAQIRREIQNS